MDEKEREEERRMQERGRPGREPRPPINVVQRRPKRKQTKIVENLQNHRTESGREVSERECSLQNVITTNT